MIVSGAPDGRNKVTAGGRVDRRCTGHAQERKQKEGSNLRGGFGGWRAVPVRDGGEADPTTELEYPFADGKWERGPGRPKVNCQ